MIIAECITLFSDILAELEFEIKQLRLKEWNWLPEKIFLVWLLENKKRSDFSVYQTASQRAYKGDQL